MVQMLILADDYTGALDCGAQLRKSGANVHIAGTEPFRFEQAANEAEVLVVNTDSRHIPAAQAKQIVRDICVSARALGVRLFYKKTDSALRGNIGAELDGMLEGSDATRAYFAPAFPAIDRTTKLCVQYIGGVPLGQSFFSQDPFEPATESHVGRVINRQCALPVLSVTAGAPLPARTAKKDVVVFDAETNDELSNIAGLLFNRADVTLLAGCAGFAEFLPVFLHLKGNTLQPHLPGKGLVAISGTLCLTALRQIEQAERDGFTIVRLSTEQKLSDLSASGKIDAFLSQVLGQCRPGGHVIITAGQMTSSPEARSRSKESALVAENLGRLAKRLVENHFGGTLLATGGDTLQGVLRALNCRDVVPVEEIEPGVEFSLAETAYGRIPIVSKAGSMGSENVYRNVADFIEHVYETSVTEPESS